MTAPITADEMTRDEARLFWVVVEREIAQGLPSGAAHVIAKLELIVARKSAAKWATLETEWAWSMAVRSEDEDRIARDSIEDEAARRMAGLVCPECKGLLSWSGMCFGYCYDLAEAYELADEGEE